MPLTTIPMPTMEVQFLGRVVLKSNYFTSSPEGVDMPFVGVQVGGRQSTVGIRSMQIAGKLRRSMFGVAERMRLKAGLEPFPMPVWQYNIQGPIIGSEPSKGVEELYKKFHFYRRKLIDQNPMTMWGAWKMRSLVAIDDMVFQPSDTGAVIGSRSDDIAIGTRSITDFGGDPEADYETINSRQSKSEKKKGDAAEGKEAIGMLRPVKRNCILAGSETHHEMSLQGVNDYEVGMFMEGIRLWAETAGGPRLGAVTQRGGGKVALSYDVLYRKDMFSPWEVGGSLRVAPPEAGNPQSFVVEGEGDFMATCMSAWEAKERECVAAWKAGEPGPFDFSDRTDLHNGIFPGVAEDVKPKRGKKEKGEAA